MNYTVDLGDVNLIVVGPDQMIPGDPTSIVIPPATVTWLDGQLQAAGKPCVIACHAPLYDTVTLRFGSTAPDWHVKDRLAIEECIADNPNAKAWVAGHTHTDMADRTSSKP